MVDKKKDLSEGVNKQDKIVSEDRRKAVQNILAGSSITAAAATSGSWSKPVLNAITVPAHAQTSLTMITLAGNASISPVTMQMKPRTNPIVDFFVGPAHAGISMATTPGPTPFIPTTPMITVPTTPFLPTTIAPTTVAPTTMAPTTMAPTTVAPTTVAPTTVAPTPSPEPTPAPQNLSGSCLTMDIDGETFDLTVEFAGSPMATVSGSVVSGVINGSQGGITVTGNLLNADTETPSAVGQVSNSSGTFSYTLAAGASSCSVIGDG